MPKTASRQTIAVDVDEVLAQFAESFVEFSNQRWGTRLSPEDWDEHWSRLWGTEHRETDKRAQDIYRSDTFRRARRVDTAEEALRKLSSNYRLVVVTSRHRAVSKDTLDWLEEHFGALFEEVHFAGIWDDLERSMHERLKATKTEICRQIGADYLIDDAPKHCIAVAGAGINAVLFGDYKWNRNVKLMPNMVRAKNWQEVLDYFDAKG